MTHASLFSGIGGFDLAAYWMGWENLFNCEVDSFCRTILKYHFPESEQYGDIKKTNFSNWCGRVDVLTGGFPCQPFSNEGERKGRCDYRYLWEEMLRAVQEIEPQWVVAENVSGLLTNAGGMEFEKVCLDLENKGYEIQSFVIPACAKGAPHRRDRVWIIANSKSKRLQRRTDTRNFEKIREEQKEQPSRLFCTAWKNFPSFEPIRWRDDGLPRGLAGITVLGHWRQSTKALGNAIVPQVAFEIFKGLID